MPEITWTNCADEMPPKSEDLIIARPWSNPTSLIKLTAIEARRRLSFPTIWEWTSHTPEKWKELNK